MPRLRDVACEKPRVLFVGINPSLTSAAVGHHFASKTNPFWRLLHAAKLVPEPIGADDDQRLAEWGLALTNLCARGTRAASELRPDEIEAGREILADKIERLRPAVVCFVGLTLYGQFFGKKGPSGGAGEKPETIAGARVFVVPNPSGLNASYPGFAHKLVWFQALERFVDGLEAAR